MEHLKFTLLLVFVIGISSLPQHKFENRIFNGNQASSDHSFVVSIQEVHYGEGFHICGGTIIANKWVLTSAMCVAEHDTTYPETLVVVAGDDHLYLDEGNEQIKHVARIRKHNGFSGYRKINDVALILLSEELQFNEHVNKIDMVESGTQVEGMKGLHIFGWGEMDLSSIISENLKEGSVDIPSHQHCNEVMGINLPDKEIQNEMLCGARNEYSQAFCDGDIGGPLVLNETLYGVMSLPEGCLNEKLYDIYSSVASYRSWIKSESGL